MQLLKTKRRRGQRLRSGLITTGGGELELADELIYLTQMRGSAPSRVNHIAEEVLHRKLRLGL